VVEHQVEKLLAGEDPFQLERLWDIMWRGTLYYGRKGIAIHAISAVDNALWDIVGKALKTPVYRFLEGLGKECVPCYCTGNNIEQAIQFGFKKLKLAIPHGPADSLTLGDGLRAYSLWGDLAYQLAGPEGYRRVENSDREHVAPGAETIRDLFGGEPALIMIDEVSVDLRKVERARPGGASSSRPSSRL
jgi:L-alanine-DL-glutamate epimerase-like enolase superfamily enzyme